MVTLPKLYFSFRLHQACVFFIFGTTSNHKQILKVAKSPSSQHSSPPINEETDRRQSKRVSFAHTLQVTEFLAQSNENENSGEGSSVTSDVHNVGLGLFTPDEVNKTKWSEAMSETLALDNVIQKLNVADLDGGLLSMRDIQDVTSKDLVGDKREAFNQTFGTALMQLTLENATEETHSVNDTDCSLEDMSLTLEQKAYLLDRSRVEDSSLGPKNPIEKLIRDVSSMSMSVQSEEIAPFVDSKVEPFVEEKSLKPDLELISIDNCSDLIDAIKLSPGEPQVAAKVKEPKEFLKYSQTAGKLMALHALPRPSKRSGEVVGFLSDISQIAGDRATIKRPRDIKETMLVTDQINLNQCVIQNQEPLVCKIQDKPTTLLRKTKKPFSTISEIKMRAGALKLSKNISNLGSKTVLSDSCRGPSSASFNQECEKKSLVDPKTKPLSPKCNMKRKSSESIEKITTSAALGIDNEILLAAPVKEIIIPSEMTISEEKRLGSNQEEEGTALSNRANNEQKNPCKTEELEIVSVKCKPVEGTPIQKMSTENETGIHDSQNNIGNVLKPVICLLPDEIPAFEEVTNEQRDVSAQEGRCLLNVIEYPSSSPQLKSVQNRPIQSPMIAGSCQENVCPARSPIDSIAFISSTLELGINIQETPGGKVLNSPMEHLTPSFIRLDSKNSADLVTGSTAKGRGKKDLREIDNCSPQFYLLHSNAERSHGSAVTNPKHFEEMERFSPQFYPLPVNEKSQVDRVVTPLKKNPPKNMENISPSFLSIDLPEHNFETIDQITNSPASKPYKAATRKPKLSNRLTLKKAKAKKVNLSPGFNGSNLEIPNGDSQLPRSPFKTDHFKDSPITIESNQLDHSLLPKKLTSKYAELGDETPCHVFTNLESKISQILEFQKPDHYHSGSKLEIINYPPSAEIGSKIRVSLNDPWNDSTIEKAIAAEMLPQSMEVKDKDARLPAQYIEVGYSSSDSDLELCTKDYVSGIANPPKEFSLQFSLIRCLQKQKWWPNYKVLDDKRARFFFANKFVSFDITFAVLRYCKEEEIVQVSKIEHSSETEGNGYDVKHWLYPLKRICSKLIESSLQETKLHTSENTLKDLPQIFQDLKQICGRADSFVKEYTRFDPIFQPEYKLYEDHTILKANFNSLLHEMCFKLAIRIEYSEYPSQALQPTFIPSSFSIQTNPTLGTGVMQAAGAVEPGERYVQRICEAVRTYLRNSVRPVPYIIKQNDYLITDHDY